MDVNSVCMAMSEVTRYAYTCISLDLCLANCADISIALKEPIISWCGGNIFGQTRAA